MKKNINKKSQKQSCSKNKVVGRFCMNKNFVDPIFPGKSCIKKEKSKTNVTKRAYRRIEGTSDSTE